MSFLVAYLGLLGLLGILCLVIIYIIKPNYQHKSVSSTFVWRLSQKYKKKKIPVSRLRNILLFICQILALTAMGLIMAHPIHRLTAESPQTDVVYVVDSSASMYAGLDGETRFSRAVSEVESAAEGVLDDGGYVSVILADGDPDFLINRASYNEMSAVRETLEALLNDEAACFYGEADVAAAMSLTGRILQVNPTAEIYFYTDTQYSVTDGVTVVSVADPSEWNVAILDAYTELQDGYYSLTVDAAYYGGDGDVTVSVLVEGANTTDNNDAGGQTIEFEYTLSCRNDEASRVVFTNDSSQQDEENTAYYLLGEKNRFYSYRSILVSIDDSDCFQVDNTFLIYGGQKEVLKVQYASSLPNPFMARMLDVLRDNYADRWDLQVTEVKQGEEPELVGYDFYIFEHSMPDILPSDGVVLMVNPDKAPAGAGFTVTSMQQYGGRLVALKAEDAEHPVMKGVNAQRIGISQFIETADYDDTYDILMKFSTNAPALAVRKSGVNQMAVLNFSLHYSNLALLRDFPTLFSNLFDYYFPPMVTRGGETSGIGNTYAVGEEIDVQSRGNEVLIESSNYAVDEISVTDFPAEVVLSVPGTYTVSQYTYFNKFVEEQIYVRTPASESNIQPTEVRLEAPERPSADQEGYKDLLIYFAAALVALLFIEWILKSMNNV